jgi:CelD/BcsL family acetyltransferase involved in cellulose biosynthesis
MLTLETLADEGEFEALERDWDSLVRGMPRPSPFLLHGWLSEWWRHFGDRLQPRVQVAFRDGRLVAALPVGVRRRHGLRVTEFLGGQESALADLMLAPGEDPSVGAQLAQRASAGSDLAALFGLPVESRLAAAVDPARLSRFQVVEAPVLDLHPGWDAVYRAKTSSKRRNGHKRSRRRLAELGQLEVHVARTPDELAAVIEDAFRLHDLRWEGRPDRSSFGTPDGRRFHRAAIARIAAGDVPRIVTLRLDGRMIAFHYLFLLDGAMVVHRLAFDPDLARHSPGLINTLDAIEAASAEGAKRVEFLGGAERFKLELADGFAPLCAGIGLAATPAGQAAAAARLGSLRLRRRLKRVGPLHRLYYRGLTPLRRATARLATTGKEAS